VSRDHPGLDAARPWSGQSKYADSEMAVPPAIGKSDWAGHASRVSKARRATALCAPMKKSGSTPVLLPPEAR
jgi:hypothetical protein